MFIEYERKSSCGVGKLRIVLKNMYADDDDKYKEAQQFPFPYTSVPPACRYLGSLVRTTDTIDVVYIEADSSGNIVVDPSLSVYSVTTKDIEVFAKKPHKLLGLSDPSCIPVISNHDESTNGTLETTKSFVDVMYVKMPENKMYVS